MAGPGFDFLKNPRGDMTVADEVHEEGRLPVGQVHGQRRSSC